MTMRVSVIKVPFTPQPDLSLEGKGNQISAFLWLGHLSLDEVVQREQSLGDAVHVALDLLRYLEHLHGLKRWGGGDEDGERGEGSRVDALRTAGS